MSFPNPAIALHNLALWWHGASTIVLANLPVLMALVCGVGLRWLPVNHGTRTLVKGLVLLLALRYMMWRSVATLHFNAPGAAFFSIAFYVAELIALLSLVVSMGQTLRSTATRRSQQADRYEGLIHVAEYQPFVDVLIPTGNQPEYVVRRTIMACQAMRYPNKTIYVLDDRGRSSIAELAAELGCVDLVPPVPDGARSKTDMLNDALAQTHGELIAVIDADFVPFRNFLDRVVGFFYRSDLALVQTPQSFEHPGVRSRACDGLQPVFDHRGVPQDGAPLDGGGQSHGDAFDSVLGRESCYVVRRQAIVDVGGYAPEGMAWTGLKLRGQGGKLVYLNERLSLGAATRTFETWRDRRWQTLWTPVQVLVAVVRGRQWRQFNGPQMLFWVSQLAHCLPTFGRWVGLIGPILALQLGVFPGLALWPIGIGYFLPFWLMRVMMQGWTAGNWRSYFWAEVDAVAFCVPALQKLCRMPLGRRGTSLNQLSPDKPIHQRDYHWRSTLPLLAILGWLVGTVAQHLWRPDRGLFMLPSNHLWPLYLWLAYNFVLVAVAIGQSIDQPLRRLCDRLPLQLPCRFLLMGDQWPGCTLDLSEQGARIHLLTEGFPVAVLPEVIALELGHPALKLNARVVAATQKRRHTYIQVAFQNPSIEQQRQLIELIYANPSDWPARPILGGWGSFRAIVGSWNHVRPISRPFR
jgi:cellulose synthase (UDP-forming)